MFLKVRLLFFYALPLPRSCRSRFLTQENLLIPHTHVITNSLTNRTNRCIALAINDDCSIQSLSIQFHDCLSLNLFAYQRLNIICKSCGGKEKYGTCQESSNQRFSVAFNHKASVSCSNVSRMASLSRQCAGIPLSP